ncbi:MAG: ATP-dependent DNA helicase RecG [Candidatus Marinimicrobia bacterium]|nr:ATP-dependent DNA helicase RecG [Candidatus Neomarinimicrobiota bacterium]
MELNTLISKIGGIGKKREYVLEEHGINTIEDLLYYFPRRHLDRSVVTKIRNLKKAKTASIIAKVEAFGEKPIRNKKLFQVIVTDGTGLLTLTWFNGTYYIRKLFKVGEYLAIHGKVDWYRGPTITHPEFDKISFDNNHLEKGGIIPIYPLTSELKAVGIEQRMIRKIIEKLLFELSLNIPEIFSKDILEKEKLISLNKALRYIHFPKTFPQLEGSKKRLKFDEHFFLQLFMAYRKSRLKTVKANAFIPSGNCFNTLVGKLDFELTDAQKRVVEEAHVDLKKNIPMNRLLQGDVGSGKTIVSILVSALTVDSSFQVALMAPTEILAQQHFNSFKMLFDNSNTKCSLLTGKMRKKERELIIGELFNGNISIIIGTHALIQEDVVFNKLGLVIIDEQHRFGVEQRSLLLKKGNHPHFLAMTATPIPRTLSITYHGDMDLSIIDELPKIRVPIITKIVDPTRLPNVYDFIKSEINLGRQCMIIYPLVEESEKSDLAAAESAYLKLSKTIFSEFNVGLIHGQMKKDQKENVMKEFSENIINIMVATTVIEVGIDIPNATVMLVEHAERFGLTQLHQLRGRVGRGSFKSYCILTRRKINHNSLKRLKIMENTNDGFLIADEDLKMRGPGEFFGTRQSGFFKFKIASMINDGKIIRRAREIAFKIINEDQSLKSPKNKMVSKYFKKYYKTQINQLTIS